MGKTTQREMPSVEVTCITRYLAQQTARYFHSIARPENRASNQGKTVEYYISQISDVVDEFFKDHRSEVISNAQPNLMVEDAQQIYFEDIKRFELSKHCFNLRLLDEHRPGKCQAKKIKGVYERFGGNCTRTPKPNIRNDGLR